MPDNWAWCRLGTLCDYGVCQSASPDEISADSWVLDLEDIEKDTGTLLQRIKKCHRPTTSNKHIFKAGNILYSKLRTYLNKVLIADIDGYCTSEILPLDFGEYILAVYARHVLMSKMFLDYTAQCGYGVKMPRLGTSDGRKALFPIPPLAEQQRIVEQIETLLKYVDVIDADAEDLDKSITLAKQKILDLAIRGKLVPQDPADEPASELLKKIKAEKEALVKAGKLKKDKHESFIFKSDDSCYHENIDGKVTDITDEIPFDLPDGWEWCRLKTFAIITTGATPSTNIPDYYGGNIPFVKPPDLGEDKYIGKTAENLTKLGATKSRIVPPKSICVCCIGSLGKSSIATDYVCTNQQINSITTSANEKFVYYLCNSSYFIAALQSMATAITIALVNKSRMEQILIPLPPLAEQKRIVSHVEKLFSVLETMRG